MHTHRREPISGLPPINECPITKSGFNSLELFDKQEISEAFGSSRCQISRDAKTLWGRDILHAPLTKPQAWMLYSVACFRRSQYAVFNRSQVKSEEILKFASRPEIEIIQLIEAVGGSRADFENRIDSIVLKRSTRKFA